MAKTQFVKDLQKDGTVQDLFAVKKKEDVRTYAKGYMFSLLISDKTGTILVKFWGGEKTETESIFSSFEEQDVVFIKGKVGEYKGNPEIHINPPEGEIKKNSFDDFDDFIATTKRNVDEMILELKGFFDNMSDPHIKQLVNDFVNDDEFMKKFVKSPAARTIHHSTKGGLLEHILNLMKMSKTLVEIYPLLNKDLLIACCFFHDIGKIVEYQLKATIDLTVEGSLFGHISIGQKIVSDRINKIENFPENLKQKIIHMILSHHGKQEWGSPVVPKIPEALAFHHLDNCDAKINQVIQLKENSPEIKQIWIKDSEGKSNLMYFD